MTTPGRTQPTAWVGWIAFAAVMMLMVGAFNIIDGLAALLKDEVYVNNGKHLLVFDLTSWGWITLLFGIFLVLVAFALFSGAFWARVVAVILVTFNAVGQLAFLSAYPIWATIIIALDVIVLWALVVHGN